MAKRRKKGEGSITFDSSRKRWRGILKINGKRKVFQGATSEEVQSLMFDFRTAIKSGLDITKTSTLREIADKFLKVKARNCTPKTLHTYETQYRVHVDKPLGGKKINDLTPSQISSFVDDMVSNGSSADQVNRTLKVLKAILSHAQKLQLIPTNPAEHVEGMKHQKKEIRALESKEIKAFVRESKSDKHHALWYLLLNSGMRIGEALSLTWEDLDFENDTLNISKTYDQEFGLKDGTKNGSTRQIKLNASTMKVLQLHHSKQLEQQLDLGKYWNPNNLIFANSVGEYVNLNNLRRRHFNEILKRANISDFKIHDLRHTMASHSLMNNISVLEVSHLLGHKTPLITMSVYAHFIPQEDKTTTDVMEKIINA